MSSTWDCIVLGVGGFGSGALRHLARRGARVLGIEQHGLPHDYGSSHGETRIIRTAYFEHPNYVPLLQRAFVDWRELELATGRRLLEPTGLFVCGSPGGETLSGTVRAAREHRLPLDLLTPEQAERRFSGFRFPAPTSVAFEGQAGWLRVEDCVAAQAAEAVRHGAQLRLQERVERWSSNGADVRVWTDRGCYHARSLVVAAGPWSAGLLRSLQVPLRVLRKVLLWFRVEAGAYRDAPCWLYETDDGAFYGFPSLDGETIKVAEHTGGEEVDDPALVDRLCRPEDIDRVAAFVHSSLPAARVDVVRHAVCMYTMSPDGHFLIDLHPEHSNVVLAAGFSGHGFKFTGVLGEALAELALERRTSLPVGFLGLSRFAAGR